MQPVNLCNHSSRCWQTFTETISVAAPPQNLEGAQAVFCTPLASLALLLPFERMQNLFMLSDLQGVKVPKSAATFQTQLVTAGAVQLEMVEPARNVT